MRSSLTVLASLVAVFFLALTATDILADTAEAADAYTVQGYIVDSNGRTPLEGVGVTITTSEGLSWIGSTDSGGLFSIGTPRNSGLYISFDLEGYALSGAPPCIDNVTLTASEIYSLSLDAVRYDSSTKTYDLTYGSGDLHYITMSQSFGQLEGVVFCNGAAVSGALVEITDGHNSYSATTDSSGRYSMRCISGNYHLTVTHTGLEDVDLGEVEVRGDSVTTKNVTMTVIDDKVYFGMDLPHFLMVIGCVFGVSLLAMILIYRSRLQKGGSGIKLMDDNKERGKE
jgi:hypothetical protein